MKLRLLAASVLLLMLGGTVPDTAGWKSYVMPSGSYKAAPGTFKMGAAATATKVTTSSGVISSPPTTADGFTQMFADKNDNEWSGGDQMNSVVAGPFTYWMVGDTMLGSEAEDGSYAPGVQMVANHILIQRGNRLENAMANGGVGVPNPSTSTPSNGERYWTQGAFYVNGFLYVLCQRVINTSYGFDLIGVEIARFTVNGATGHLTLTNGMIRTPSSGVRGGNTPAHTQWAVDAVVAGGQVYVYGYAGADDPYAPQRTYLARVPADRIGQLSAWRYWSQTAAGTNYWPSQMSMAKDIGHTQVSSVRYINGKFVMLHKPWNGYGTDVFMETSSSPWGPFTSKKVFESPAGNWEGKRYVTYGVQLHPEQKLASGKLLCSIDWNGVDFFTDVLGNADLYKPRFFEVDQP